MVAQVPGDDGGVSRLDRTAARNGNGKTGGGGFGGGADYRWRRRRRLSRAVKNASVTVRGWGANPIFGGGGDLIERIANDYDSSLSADDKARLRKLVRP